MREHRFADPAERERCDGDAELRPRDVAIEMLKRRLDSLRAPVALRDHFVDFAASGGDERKLCCHKEAVYRDQSKNGNHAACRYGEGRRVGGLHGKSKDHKAVIYIVVET